MTHEFTLRDILSGFLALFGLWLFVSGLLMSFGTKVQERMGGEGCILAIIGAGFLAWGVWGLVG